MHHPPQAVRMGACEGDCAPDAGSEYWVAQRASGTGRPGQRRICGSRSRKRSSSAPRRAPSSSTRRFGALIFAWVIGHTAVFQPEIREAFVTIGQDALKGSFWTVLLRAIFAGWLIALMVWLLPGAEHSRPMVIIILTFLAGLGGFAHIIAGSVEIFYLLTTGAASWGHGIGGWLVPTLIGNIVGGLLLVAALNHAQVTSGGGEESDGVRRRPKRFRCIMRSPNFGAIRGVLCCAIAGRTVRRTCRVRARVVYFETE